MKLVILTVLFVIAYIGGAVFYKNHSSSVDEFSIPNPAAGQKLQQPIK